MGFLLGVVVGVAVYWGWNNKDKVATGWKSVKDFFNTNG